MLYVGSWYFLVMKEFLKKLIVGVLLIICIGLNFEKSNIIADEWSEPVKFYNSYGNSAVFKPKMVDYLKKALIYGHTSRISS